MSNRDYSKIKSELLKQLLQSRSSSEVSRLMGYSFDQIRRWQSGSKELRWDEFCDLCEVLKVPLMASLKSIFLFETNDADELYFFMAHLRKRHLRWSLRELHEKTGVHPSVLKRYLSGQVFPSLETVFSFVDLHKNHLSGFLFSLIGNQSLTSFDETLQANQNQVTTEASWPLAAAIEGLLSIEEYLSQPSHDEQWFLDKLAVSRGLFQRTWKHMLEAGLIEEKNGKYQITYTTINTQGATPLQICKTGEFWSERSRLRFLSPEHKPLNKPSLPSAMAYRVVPLSKESTKKANDILLKAFHDILAVAEDGAGPYEDVRVFFFHHFSVSDAPHQPLETVQDTFQYETGPDGSISSENS